MDEQVLAGGVGNAGLVSRVGDTVRRPWHESTPAVQALLGHLDRQLPGVAPKPLGQDESGREVVSWLPGEVAIDPLPAWVTTEAYLVSLAELIRRIHDAIEGWRPPPDARWSGELADPHGGPLIAHADICPDNIVVRDGRAVAVIDWEFAAPGRRIWDVVSTVRLCVPFTHPSRRDAVYAGLDAAERVRLFADAYGLVAGDRALFTEVLRERRVVGERFVRGRVARGEAAFAKKWDTPAGEAKLQAEREWVDGVPAGILRRCSDADPTDGWLGA